MKIRIDPLDTLFSEFIRKRAMARVGGCERCLHPKFDTFKDDGSTFPAWKKLQTSHFIGRSNKSVRWDEENAAALCFGCHQHFQSQPIEHYEWFKKRLGERFDLLQGRARIIYPKPDKEAIKLYLTKRIEDVTS